MNRITVAKVFAILFPLVTYLILAQRARGLILFGLWLVAILIQQYIPLVVFATIGLAIYMRWDAWKLAKERETPRFKNTGVDLGTGTGGIVDLNSKNKKEPDSQA